MSADNYIAVIKCIDGRYRGFMGFASDETHALDLMKSHSQFDVETLDEAIEKATDIHTEYGLHFFNERKLRSAIAETDVRAMVSTIRCYWTESRLRAGPSAIELHEAFIRDLDRIATLLKIEGV